MKILEVATDAPPYKGGISRLVGLLSDGLKQRGHRVNTLTPKIRFREFKLSSIPLRQYDAYDVIHLHGPTPFLSDLMFIANFKSPIVYTHHAEISWLSEKLSKIYRGFHHFLAKKARAVIVHSNDYARLFKGYNVVTIRMPCAFEPPKDFDVEEKMLRPYTVLFVGQLRPFKGVPLLIKAAKELNDVNFVFIGEGYLRKKFERAAKNLRNVRFVGSVTDEELKKWYKLAHVICLPSVNSTEAWGLVLVEGALYGCVPLASNIIGVRENVSRLMGLLLEPKQLKSLVEKIKMLLNMELWMYFAKRSTKAAHNFVNKYTPRYYIQMHERVFKSVYQ